MSSGKKNQQTSLGRSYGKDEDESAAAALGSPTRGFEEDEEFRKYQQEGVGFMSLSEVLDVDEADEAAGSSSEPLAGLQAGAEPDPNDPDILNFGQQDLRFGGQDVSGISEWTLRAHNLQLDDGLDEGDVRRSDEALLSDIVELCVEYHYNLEAIECTVQGAQVTLRGRVPGVERREFLENAVRSIAGVQEVISYLETK